MSYSNNLKDVPNVNSEEFEKFLKDNHFDKLVSDNDKKDFEVFAKSGKPIGKILLDTIDRFITKHPVSSAGIIISGTTYIGCSIFVRLISQGVFKGNLKTIKYIDKYMN